MKVTVKANKVTLMIEIDESRYREFVYGESLKEFERNFFEMYAGQLAHLLSGSLLMGNDTPHVLSFLSVQIAEDAKILADRTPCLIGKQTVN